MLFTAYRTAPVRLRAAARGGRRFSESVPHGVESHHVEVRNTEFSATDASMLELSYVLEDVVERTVIDKTGLISAYDLHLQWAPDLTGGSRQRDSSVYLHRAPGAVGAETSAK